MAEPNTSAHRFAKVFCEKLHFSLFFRLLRPPASKGGFSVVEINGTGNAAILLSFRYLYAALP